MRLLILPGMDGTDLLFDAFLAALPKWIDPTVVHYPSDRVMSYDELLDWIEVLARISHHARK